MPFYENVFIVRQALSTTQVESLTETLTALIRDHGGQVSKVEPWGLRHFAYKIKKQRKGYYVLMNIDAPIQAINELERSMKLNEDILRFLIIRVEALDETPSPMMLHTERLERGRHFETTTPDTETTTPYTKHDTLQGDNILNDQSNAKEIEQDHDIPMVDNE